nr:GNAT family N-acetyltransferase [Allomuricauda sp.]
MEQIRLAKKEDAISIALLGRVTFTQTFRRFFSDFEGLNNYLDATFAVEKIERGLEKENNVYWVAFVNRLPVGYAKLKLDSPSNFVPYENVGQLQKIYVLQDFLSLKIGKRLQDALLEKAKASGCEHIWLSVYKENQRALRFYEKNDFKIVGEHQFSIGNDTFDFEAMSKRL